MAQNPLKRKTPPVDENAPAAAKDAAAVVVDDDDDDDDDADEHTDFRDQRPASPTQVRPGEYEAGYVVCPACHKEISFRDEPTGKFSIDLWNQHRESCTDLNPSNGNSSPRVRFAQDQPRHLISPTINVYSASRPDPTDIFSLVTHPHPPTKRRRAKRTEEERIAYLRADPYVAQFEAYRVHCRSCEKWIRLRPNSTYCSIPWDAHRKSCLSKKITNKNTYALDERNSLFSKDPDVRKFDAERVLCAVCDQWIPINPEDHLQAVQTWLTHRGECAKRAVGAVSGTPLPGPSSVPSLHDLRSNVPSPSHSRRSPHHPTSPSHRDIDSYRHAPIQPHPLHTYMHRIDLSSKETRSRHHEPSSKAERKDKPEPVEDLDADADVDADADADGDPESDLEASQTRAGPSLDQIPVNERRISDKPLSLSSVLSQHPAPPSSAGSITPPALDSPVEAGSQSEPVIYSPAAGIFPPGPVNESRRRNAEQRAATLRADRLIKHVEPNRVFCSLCEKWVQLRQDSSYLNAERRSLLRSKISRRGVQWGRFAEYTRYRIYPPENRSSRGHHPHHAGNEDELEYFSGSEQGPSNEEDGMNVRFHYRGLSASASAASEARSGSVESIIEDEGYARHPRAIPRSYSQQSQQQTCGSTEGDVDAGGDDVDNNDQKNGDSRASSTTTKPEAEGSEETSRKASTGQGQPSSESRSPSIRHRPIAPRDAPHPLHSPHPRNETASRRTQPHGHSLVSIPTYMQPGRSHDLYVTSGSSGPYRQQREREYISHSQSGYSQAHGGKVSRDRTHRASRGQQSQSNRASGLYTGGALPSSASGSGSKKGVLADLDSSAGRKYFVSHSVAYLFQTTYDCSPNSSDELSISALVAYLNAAMPIDKHEDFDTAEVVRCIGALRDKGRLLLEGDIVKKIRRD
ncbi:hypothetical protein BDP27DRAFT_1360483 [Rhodocollybia butyracea]|uniref:Uncharacterized protein n=1 Tax=Rhodocollybia butyracea TaxID=206335 RepID=A0A9P5Q1U7_9AGAR|nr:hypothetical protein BDP27DRAFT_1360483 [Rhodocollybia butyracea]